MKVKGKWIGFSAIILVYAFLYIATSKDYPCPNCDKHEEVRKQLQNNRPYVTDFMAWDTVATVLVNDSTTRNWNSLADTTCTYLDAVSLHGMHVTVRSRNTGDTLAKKKCP